MSKVAIIADDLTGANATGVLLARRGYRTGTFLSIDKIDEEQLSGFQVISVSTDSRAAVPGDAYAAVQAAAQTLLPCGIELFCKRIDSTLRGNIGAEIDALLDVTDPDTLAIVVASFPSSGRVTIGDYLLVHSVPLEKTFAAKDPKTPVSQSRVTAIVAEQSRYPIGFVGLDTVLQGPQRIEEKVFRLKEEGKRIIVFDALTEEELDQIAAGICQSGLKVVAVDPGPFTNAMVKHKFPAPGHRPGKKLLMIVGSVTPLIREQLKRVSALYETHFVYADAKALGGSAAEAEIQRVCQELLQEEANHPIIGVRTVRREGDILNIEDIARSLNQDVEHVAARIAEGLGKIARIVLEKSSGGIGALYTSGGDTTLATCREIQAAGIEVKDEVIPLAAYGRIIGGLYEQMPIITKGGLVGDEDAICKCVEYLTTKVSNDF